MTFKLFIIFIYLVVFVASIRHLKGVHGNNNKGYWDNQNLRRHSLLPNIFTKDIGVQSRESTKVVRFVKLNRYDQNIVKCG